MSRFLLTLMLKTSSISLIKRAAASRTCSEPITQKFIYNKAKIRMKSSSHKQTLSASIATISTTMYLTEETVRYDDLTSFWRNHTRPPVSKLGKSKSYKEPHQFLQLALSRVYNLCGPNIVCERMCQ